MWDSAGFEGQGDHRTSDLYLAIKTLPYPIWLVHSKECGFSKVSRGCSKVHAIAEVQQRASMSI